MNLKKISEILPSGLEGKLIRLVIILVFSVGIAFFIISNIQVVHLNDVVIEESEKEIDLVQDELLVAMSDITENSLLQLSIWAADKIDDEFWILVHDMRGLRSQVEDVFINPEDYECRKIMEPSPENAGKYVI
jgi:sigma-B regulation protein RsbU (phosphoserine phosphatase)